MKTIIMAGGRGTRIASVASDIPKPLIMIAGKPILLHEIECLKNQGFTDLILTVSHMADKIMEYFGDGSKFGVNIRYFVEDSPLGNAGALFKLYQEEMFSEDEDFLLLNADSMFDVDFHRFLDFHKSKHALVSLFTHPNSHPYDSGLIISEDGIVRNWLTKEDARPKWYKNRVNAGLHIVNSQIFGMTDIDIDSIGTEVDGKTYKVDLDRQVIKPLVNTGKVAAYDSPEYVKDMGTPERFEQVTNDLISGKVSARNLMNKQKAVFLDRDGTINKYVGFLRSIDEFELLPGVIEAIHKINDSGYLAIVATNQPVIARGEVTYSELEEIHNKMETLLGEKGAYIDALYYCPHHPDKGFDGEIPELKFECECRKPKPGMLLKATEDFNIDLENSWMIGDGANDVLAGKNAGCKTAIISDNNDCNADVCVNNLLEFVERYLIEGDK
ncbi:HAD-IIIA family hydrolase [Butyrivibrio sp. M55]|uniref:HAD-IIIA family hydrolase n=1 Tax=Butyrivibrio sp. M55 TaxID=1855323 RepID=UPI0008E38844|nr:HAD-IIIA family hydrolase [Butyrivibrio sp. M55]SFU85187.1 D-glycero-D-manno-heptose 1,7-bisphosphate phosphatase [Butyrivibrio sp. M55]